MSQIENELVSGISLFADLESDALEGLLGIFQRVTFEAGACLVRQGQPANSAYIVESGTAQVITMLPGGGNALVATLGPGSVFGEMALLERGTRSATVVADTALSGYSVERDRFRGLLAQSDRAAIAIQERIMRGLCRRLRDLNEKIIASEAPEAVAPPAVPVVAASRPARRGGCAFDFRRFLPLLPLLERFSAAEIDELAARGHVLELERGDVLFRQGEPCAACYIVVRGAVELSTSHQGRRHRLAILGPGRLCGHMGLIDSAPHSTSSAAREHTTLLELDKRSFLRLFQEADGLAEKFRDMINHNLLEALAHTTNHLTRLVSQARIRGRRKEQKQAEALQRALATEDCRTA